MLCMDDITDIHTTARSYFLVRIIDGEIPSVCDFGRLDGLAYFEIELAGTIYWLTEYGLFNNPRQQDDLSA